MRIRTVIPAAAALLAISSAAHAEPNAPFGERAPFVIGIDHLAGVVHMDDAPWTLTHIGSGVGLFAPALTPRIAMHGFVTSVVSLGAAAQVWSVGRDGDQRLSILGVHPRVGAALTLDSHNAFWFRGGGGFIRISEAGRDSTVWVVAGEVLYVYTPVQHFGITLGPMIEAAVKSTNTSDWMVYGLTFGTLVDL